MLRIYKIFYNIDGYLDYDSFLKRYYDLLFFWNEDEVMDINILTYIVDGFRYYYNSYIGQLNCFYYDFVDKFWMEIRNKEVLAIEEDICFLSFNIMQKIHNKVHNDLLLKMVINMELLYQTLEKINNLSRS